MSEFVEVLDARVRRRIVALRARGLSFSRIAVLLNQRGYLSCRGGRWYGASVRKLVLVARPPSHGSI